MNKNWLVSGMVLLVAGFAIAVYFLPEYDFSPQRELVVFGGVLMIVGVALAIYGARAKPSPKEISIKKVSLATVLISLGVVLAPYLWFPVLDSKAYPGQHLVNAIGGVLLGPIWAAFIAFCIGIIRMSLAWGTIFSMPGGIPGGMMVGFIYWLLRKIAGRYAEAAALTEPIGTIFIGGTLAVYIFAPVAGRTMLLIPTWIGWAISSIIGAIIGFITLIALKMAGIRREIFSR